MEPITKLFNAVRNDHRPFLVVDIYSVPAKEAKTHKKGWGEAMTSWNTNEHPYLVDRITPKHLRQASIIIDINNETMVKNRFDDGTDGINDDVMAHYTTKYAEYIQQAKKMSAMRERIREIEQAA